MGRNNHVHSVNVPIVRFYLIEDNGRNKEELRKIKRNQIYCWQGNTVLD